MAATEADMIGEAHRKATDVKIGSEYEARIGKETIWVRITAEKPAGGWSAVNTATLKKVFISTARILKAISGTTVTTEGNLTIVEVPPATVETIDGAKKLERKKGEAKPEATRTALSQLDAAVKVLGESPEPLTTKAMVEAMAAKNYWSSPGGKTPHATLYSAILRELQSKGDASRFIKTDRGHFRLRTA